MNSAPRQPDANGRDPILSVEHLETHFLTRAGVAKAVDDVSFALARGEVMGLVGESGSGKSVTGYSIMGLVDAPGEVVGGSVRFEGEDLLEATNARLQQLRGNRIAMIFQDAMMTLNPVLRIDTQMIEAVQVHERVSRQAAYERALDVLDRVGIAAPDERIKAYPHQFSGGMRQRVCIAIALINRPALIIADEPTTALDVTIQGQILYEVQKLCRETGTALIWITHDLSVVAGLADRVCVMYSGRIVETGTTDDVLDRPAHPYTRGLIGSIPSHNKRGQPLAQIPGMAPTLLNVPTGCAFRTRCTFSSEACRRAPEVSEPMPGRLIRCFHPLVRGAS